jgi:prevent-host-death family protein
MRFSSARYANLCSMHSTNHKGNVAEAAIAAAAIKLGIAVLRPVVEHTRYDLIFDVNGRLLRVQCKWAPVRGDVIAVNLAGYRHTARGPVRSTYTPDEIDGVAVYCEERDECYWLPAERIERMRAIQLRIAPTKNGQKAQLNWASDYELSGAVAQLGRALAWHARGHGFKSRQLHSPSESLETVGAHVFRNQFAWYMERAHAGERFLVTRRGKPSVRLIPANDQLGVA